MPIKTKQDTRFEAGTIEERLPKIMTGEMAVDTRPGAGAKFITHLPVEKLNHG